MLVVCRRGRSSLHSPTSGTNPRQTQVGRVQRGPVSIRSNSSRSVLTGGDQCEVVVDHGANEARKVDGRLPAEVVPGSLSTITPCTRSQLKMIASCRLKRSWNVVYMGCAM